MGNDGEAVEWLEHVCTCVNVLSWLSNGLPTSPNREHLSKDPHRAKCSPSRAHADAHALALNPITHEMNSH